MRGLVAAAIAFVVLMPPVHAQDAPELSFWNGPYGGLVSGGALGTSIANTEIGCPNGAYLCDETAFNKYLENGLLIGETATGSSEGNGALLGVVGGYDWLSGSVVTGIVADASATSLAVSNGGSAPSINVGLIPSVFTVSATAAADWLVTVRGRAGIVVAPTVLLYATGGVALAHLTVSNDYLDTMNEGGRGNSSTSSLVAGYALGAGAEWAFDDGWRLTAEYLYVDFGSLTTIGGITITGAGTPNPMTSTADLSAHLLKTGIVHGF